MAQECFAEELRNSAWDLALGVKIHLNFMEIPPFE
jgi:hypothetical protein